jgi:glyoxylase-like metal-dependent hydrolase (beta-lactamase superfamily II)/rhodanese-related sulfurtransferase
MPGPSIEEINDANCKTYLVVVGDEAALVDPVRDRFDTYRLVLRERALRLRLVLETHTHADHLMLNREAKDVLGVSFVMHERSPIPLVDRHVRDGDTLQLGDVRIDVMHTPGHTPDSVCYRIGTTLLSGDTLMIRGSGRTDFPGGDAGAQYDAVTQRLFALPDDTLVLPGHDYNGNKSSTIGDERARNPRFLGRSRDEYVKLMAELGLPFPVKTQQALQVNQSSFEAHEVGFPLVADVAALPALLAPDVATRLRSGAPPLLLDVREPEEFVGALGHIEGSLLVPLDALERRLPKLAGYADRDVVVVCRAGARSASAGAILQRAGFHRVFNLEGGMLEWIAAGLPVAR